MKRFFLKIVAMLAFAFVLLSCFAEENPKYVFLFIGDGMGKHHVDFAREVYGELNMDKLPVKGSVSTVNASKQTTDSAASGTAFACGVKTSNGRLGIDANDNKVDSCAVLAKKQGRKVAILTTVGANNATPAAFYAHIKNRRDNETVMKQYADVIFDILAGASIDGVSSKINLEDYLSGKAYQEQNKVKEGIANFTGKGILVFSKPNEQFFPLKKLEQPVFICTKDIDNLKKYVKKSIDLMEDSPKGFFMMAEGGHIDHGAHGNNVAYMLAELKKFDEAVGVALDFYQKHPKETLIIVTADHDTGGLKLLGSKVQKELIETTVASLKIDIEKDDEATILSKLKKQGIKCDAKETNALKEILSEKDPKKQKKDFNKFAENLINSHIGISWTSRGHTSNPVYLFAIGVCSKKFAGEQENSDVGTKLKEFFAK